jgi:hypothetical protein
MWSQGGRLLWECHVQRVLELSIKSPSLHPCLWAYFHPLSPLFSGIRIVMKFCLLNLSMKCWNSSSNAQGSKEIMIIVWVGAVKNTCSSSGGAQGKMKNTIIKLSLSPKLMVFSSFNSIGMLVYLFQVLKNTLKHLPLAPKKKFLRKKKEKNSCTL